LPGIAHNAAMRYVILFHQTPAGYPRGDHWDFMLEVAGTLRTWALENEPGPQREIAAELLADHRIEYLTYEGPISGGRGLVTRWDGGTYEPLEPSATQWRIVLAGDKLRCEVCLEAGDAQRWSVSFGGEATAG
jgi:DNA polymerase Ligase (LigD)